MEPFSPAAVAFGEDTDALDTVPGLTTVKIRVDGERSGTAELRLWIGGITARTSAAP